MHSISKVSMVNQSNHQHQHKCHQSNWLIKWSVLVIEYNITVCYCCLSFDLTLLSRACLSSFQLLSLEHPSSCPLLYQYTFFVIDLKPNRVEIDNKMQWVIWDEIREKEDNGLTYILCVSYFIEWISSISSWLLENDLFTSRMLGWRIEWCNNDCCGIVMSVIDRVMYDQTWTCKKKKNVVYQYFFEKLCSIVYWTGS